MQNLHELEPEALDRARRAQLDVVRRPGVGEDSARLGVERRNQRVEVTRIDNVVCGQVGDQLGARCCDPGVQRGAETAVRL